MTGALALLLVILGSSCARADVGVVLNESLNTSVARITGSGHSAIYLSRICPASPVKLRMCGPDEQGSIISNYTTLGEDEPFEWNIVPLNVYLYGFLNPQEKPLFASEKIKALLEERYREDSLIRYCAGPPCTTSKKAEWREMVAETSSRSIYIFAVKTTVQQDMDLVARFNAMPNENHFNAFIRNCANFTEGVINTYFPNAAKPDYINDFGLTSPKAIARSFAHYAERHPASEYQVLHFAQLPGTIKRSTVARDGTEQLYRSKKLLIPMVLVASHELPVFAASYILTGRFDPEHEFEQHSSERATAIDYQIRVGSIRKRRDSRRRSEGRKKRGKGGGGRQPAGMGSLPRGVRCHRGRRGPRGGNSGQELSPPGLQISGWEGAALHQQQRLMDGDSRTWQDLAGGAKPEHDRAAGF